MAMLMWTAGERRGEWKRRSLEGLELIELGGLQGNNNKGLGTEQAAGTAASTALAA